MFDLGAQFGLLIVGRQYFWSGIQNYVEVRNHVDRRRLVSPAVLAAWKSAQPCRELSKEGANQFAGIAKTRAHAFAAPQRNPVHACIAAHACPFPETPMVSTYFLASRESSFRGRLGRKPQWRLPGPYTGHKHKGQALWPALVVRCGICLEQTTSRGRRSHLR